MAKKDRQTWIFPHMDKTFHSITNTVTFLYILGDMVMSSFPYPQLSLSHTVDGVSHHSADGYMFDYALNLLTLNYLQVINVLEPDDKERSLELMQTSKLNLFLLW